MTIHEVAAKIGVSAHTIRFYEKSGILPPIRRTEGGVRQFSEADTVFLSFVLELKRTGMSLAEIMEFTEDGCLLERLQQGVLPSQPVEKRLAILHKHEERLREQRRKIDELLESVRLKTEFYERYLENQTARRLSLRQEDATLE